MEQSFIKQAPALVFSGGGARGAFEYGVWKALRELGTTYEIQGIAGTSIGALNTLFYIQKDFYKAGDIWRSLSTEDVIRINRSFLSLLMQLLKTYPGSVKKLPDILKLVPFLQSFEGFLDDQTLHRILETNTNMTKIANNRLDTYICCTRLPDANNPALAPVYFDIKNNHYRKEDLISILMASSAIYPFFDKVEIQGSYYIDGGFTDNTPIRPLYDAGYRKFIVVHLSSRSADPKKAIPPFFSDCRLVEIYPNDRLPTGPKTTLDFSQESITAFMEDGYVQTMVLAEDIAALTL